MGLLLSSICLLYGNIYLYTLLLIRYDKKYAHNDFINTGAKEKKIRGKNTKNVSPTFQIRY